ncbi:MAG: phenylphosphate carboxylase subunit delta [Fimbriimonadaceae bacterium]|nr:phenylphosphate carboxylase subunit delta [Fimbriimonadaceae bacterium]
MREQQEVAARMQSIRALVLDVDGVLTDGGLRYGASGEEHKQFHTRDDVGLRLAQAAGWQVVVITAMAGRPLAAWAAERDITELHMDINDKRSKLREVTARLGLALADCAYVGDDLLDLPSMDLCGLRAAPADALVLVRQKVDLVLSLPGGRGAVRELIDRVLEVQGRTVEVLHAYYARRGVTEHGSLVPTAAESCSPKIGFRS